MQQETMLTHTINGDQISVPAEAALLAYLEKVVDSRLPIALESSVLRTGAFTGEAPAIGADWKDGKYAGLTIFENAPCHLVLMPGELESTSWGKAVGWASKEQRGSLPSRFDALVLFQNLKDEFKDEAYWTADVYARDAGYAWCLSFGNGNQNCYPQGDELRARAVRRVPL